MPVKGREEQAGVAYSPAPFETRGKEGRPEEAKVFLGEQVIFTDDQRKERIDMYRLEAVPFSQTTSLFF